MTYVHDPGAPPWRGARVCFLGGVGHKVGLHVLEVRLVVAHGVFLSVSSRRGLSPPADMGASAPPTMRLERRGARPARTPPVIGRWRRRSLYRFPASRYRFRRQANRRRARALARGAGKLCGDRAGWAARPGRTRMAARRALKACGQQSFLPTSNQRGREGEAFPPSYIDLWQPPRARMRPRRLTHRGPDSMRCVMPTRQGLSARRAARNHEQKLSHRAKRSRRNMPVQRKRV